MFPVLTPAPPRPAPPRFAALWCTKKKKKKKVAYALFSICGPIVDVSHLEERMANVKQQAFYYAFTRTTLALGTFSQKSEYDFGWIMRIPRTWFIQKKRIYLTTRCDLLFCETARVMLEISSHYEYAVGRYSATFKITKKFLKKSNSLSMLWFTSSTFISIV